MCSKFSEGDFNLTAEMVQKATEAKLLRKAQRQAAILLAMVIGLSGEQFREYSQLLPCGHPIITDTHYYGQNPALPPAEAIKV